MAAAAVLRPQPQRTPSQDYACFMTSEWQGGRMQCRPSPMATRALARSCWVRRHLRAPPQEFAALPLDALGEEAAAEQAGALYAALAQDAERMPALRAMLQA